MTVALKDVLVTLLLSRSVLSVPLSLNRDTVWSQDVRLRHLYAARTGLHLEISADGRVRGSAPPSPYTLLQITAVGPGLVVLRAVTSDLFLCMLRDASLYGSAVYHQDDCTFREQIYPDGYSVYSSESHGQLLSLGTPRQRQRGRDRGVPALAQFLPRLDALEVPPHPDLPSTPAAPFIQQSVDHVDAFGRISQIIHSPSFHER